MIYIKAVILNLSAIEFVGKYAFSSYIKYRCFDTLCVKFQYFTYEKEYNFLELRRDIEVWGMGALGRLLCLPEKD